MLITLQEIDRRPEAFVVSASSKEVAWNAFILNNLQAAYKEAKYVLVTSRSLVGTYAVMYCREDHHALISHVSTAIAPCGLMGVMGNKGAVAIRVKIDSEYLCFVGSHLAAHAEYVARRNQDYLDLCNRLLFSPPLGHLESKSRTSVESLIDSWNDTPFSSSIWDCAILIWAGDLNYRIELPRVETRKLALSGQYGALLQHDQLTKERAAGRVFDEFEEAPILFPPSFKYNVGSDSFDSSKGRRAPAWTDRVVFRKSAEITPVQYSSSMALRSSDHKPVSCTLNAKIHGLVPQKFDSALSEALHRVDMYENEAIPMTTLSTNVLKFEELAYQRPVVKKFELLNVGQVMAKFTFIPRPGHNQICASWLSVLPFQGILIPGVLLASHLVS